MTMILQSTNGTPTVGILPGSTFPVGSWDESSTSFGSCTLKKGTYKVMSLPQDTLKVCLNTYLITSSFTLQAYMTIHRGTIGGIVIDWSQFSGVYNDFYYVFITTKGVYGFLKGVHQNCPGQGCIRPLYRDFSPVIKQGLDQLNIVIIKVLDNNVYLAVNGQFLHHFSDKDSPYNTGGIGLAAGFDPSEIMYSHIELWEPTTCKSTILM